MRQLARTNGDLRMRERMCLSLAALIRRTGVFPLPEDLSDDNYINAYFDDELAKGLEFGKQFRIPLVLEGQTVLEIGSGYGGMQLALAKRGASRVIGIDIEPSYVEYARTALSSSANIEVLLGDATDIPLDDESVDVVIGDSVIEHVHDLDAVLAEVRRVLRPGGYFFGLWGNSWLTYNGPHLIKCLPIPWIHLLFSDETIISALVHLKDTGAYPDSYLAYKLIDFPRMGRATRHSFQSAAERQEFDILEHRNQSPRRWKEAVARLPILDEFLAGQLTEVLAKR